MIVSFGQKYKIFIIDSPYSTRYGILFNTYNNEIIEIMKVNNKWRVRTYFSNRWRIISNWQRSHYTIEIPYHDSIMSKGKLTQSKLNPPVPIETNV